ncbi:MAG: hypothetical protein PF518_17920 [Spirochaetaceae bacterium]|jgi:nucleoside-triphosphatase|nr:hypothetical protein [Spirochaetaceae bacterium]
MVTIITGDRGIGKTTFLQKKKDYLSSENKLVTGILTPASYDTMGNKNGFYALNLGNDEKWELARSDKNLGGPSYGPFLFSSHGLDKANNILINNLKKNMGIVFLDEIGPLELQNKQGFYPCFPYIRKIKKQLDIYVVVRPELVNNFIELLLPGTKGYNLITVTEKNRNSFF